MTLTDAQMNYWTDDRLFASSPAGYQSALLGVMEFAKNKGDWDFDLDDTLELSVKYLFMSDDARMQERLYLLGKAN